MESFGAYLKSIREEKGIRLEEMASITKIHVSHLKNMEMGRWDKLPPEPFIRGFVTSYANYVGADPKDCIRRYQEETGREIPKTLEEPKHADTPSTATATHTPSSLQPISMGKVAGIGGILAVVAVIGILISIGQQEESASTVTQVKSTPVETAPQATTEKGKTAVVEASATPVPNPGEKTQIPRTITNAAHELYVEGKERSWVKVVVDDELPKEFFLAADGRVLYKASEKIKLILGNAEGAKVYHNGTLIEGRTLKPGIRFFRFPAGAQFPQDAPKPKVAEKTEEDED